MIINKTNTVITKMAFNQSNNKDNTFKDLRLIDV